MKLWRANRSAGIACAAIGMMFCSLTAMAAEYRGEVAFQGMPVPGAVVTVTHGKTSFTAITGKHGSFAFPKLANGSWVLTIRITGFVAVKENVNIPSTSSLSVWKLKMLALSQMHASIRSAETATSPRSLRRSPRTGIEPKLRTPNSTTEAQDVLARNGPLLNGSQNDAASSAFAQIPAFGNHRNAGHSLYNGGLGLITDNSAFDARPFSLTGSNTPKPQYNNVTAIATFGGPFRIPKLLPKGPNVFAQYEWTRNSDAALESGRMPDRAERNGDLSQLLSASGQPVEIFNPNTGQPFPNNVIPAGDLSSQAQALLNLYPLPNTDNAGAGYNYQAPVVSKKHQDALQLHWDQSLGGNNQLYGLFALQSTRDDNPNLLGFLDKTDLLGVNTDIHWWHRLSSRLFLNSSYSFSRLRLRLDPFFEDRENISGDAGIHGNDQNPTNWGPPTLTFSSGITPLSDAESTFNRNETDAVSASLLWVYGRQSITFGGDFRRQEFNDFSQQDPRGTFTFTGAATQGKLNGATVGGSDLADFLLGIPDTSSIAFGNADKYFRESVYDAYIDDDWQLFPGFTIDAGFRWEYGAPMTELYGRLVNLDITPGFKAAAPVVGSDPIGPLTGRTYPSSLIEPDKSGFEPRLGIAWRPFPGSSLVVRAGYGIYDDTSVYQTIATQMAQQAPLSKSLSVANSLACPLTLANGFNTCPTTSPDNFAVNPNFRVGYAQNWQLSVQSDLPGSLQLTASYLGTKGTRGPQEFLPNTWPIGASDTCPSCPIGFAYLTSNGNSTREAGQIQLRRRLHNGLTGSIEYTYAKALDDDAALGGQGASAAANNASPTDALAQGTSSSADSSPTSFAIAQDWRDPSAERGLSSFDQRNALTASLQYTTGMGLGGGTLMSGWKGVIFKQWSLLTQIKFASGMPQTPVFLAAVPGTGITGTIRPDTTGAPIYSAPPGRFLNPAAYAAPKPGHWGTARRNSITGPDQFSLNASLGRTFPLRGRYNLNIRTDATNVLNHVTYTDWNVTVTSPQFGLPLATNAMRSVQITARLRF